MGTPQDPRTRRRERTRRAKKNLLWEARRARENAEAADSRLTLLGIGPGNGSGGDITV